MNKLFSAIKNKFGNFANSEKSNKKDLLVKVCCVFFAVVLWYIVVLTTGNTEYEKTYYSVPVSISNANLLSENGGLSILSGYDYNINITVRGNRSKLSTYTSEDIIASADVSSIEEAGEHNVPVEINCPPSSGFSVVSQSLDTIKISVDKLVSVDFDVDVNIQNARYDVDKYALGTPVVSPQKITVKGPEKLLESISGAFVNLDLGNINSNIGFNSRIVLLDNNSEQISSPYISLSKDYAEGTVPLLPIEEATKIIEKVVPLVASFKHGYYNASNTSVIISPANVTIRGYESTLSKIESIDVFSIDETKFTSSTIIGCDIVPPENTTLVSDVNKAVITLLVSEQINSKPLYIDVDDLTLGDGIHLTDGFYLTFMGDSESINSLLNTKDSYTLSVDTSNITQNGTYQLVLKVDISPSFKNVWAKYTEVMVTVEK